MDPTPQLPQEMGSPNRLTENSSLAFSLLCPRLVCFFCQNCSGCMMYTTCIWAGRASCVWRYGGGRGDIGEERTSGGGLMEKEREREEEETGMEGRDVGTSGWRSVQWQKKDHKFKGGHHQLTCSVLRMSFVFCQFEFLASTITLNPFSRTSSLKQKNHKKNTQILQCQNNDITYG